MRWRGRRQSSNIEDRRGQGGRRRLGGRRAGVGGIGVIILALVGAYFGVDPSIILGGLGGGPGGGGAPRTEQPVGGPRDELSQFVGVVLADTEDVWNRIFEQGLKRRYSEPKLVMFTDSVRSACGLGQAAMGPFYCPGDQKVYVDLSFYRDLRERHGAPGDFAQAYVIAHEVGHHVQTLLGISEKVHARKRRVSKVESNQLSVRQELQADCFAGLWAHHAQRTKQILEAGDIEEALGAASAIGDDRLQRQGRGYVTPESFTHGSSKQRVRWFQRGFETGKLSACDTFSTRSL